jgi:predicted nucleic acid-binding protein
MRVVLDTNVLVSALLKRDSVHGRLLQAVWDGTLDLVLSELLHHPGGSGDRCDASRGLA